MKRTLVSLIFLASFLIGPSANAEDCSVYQQQFISARASGNLIEMSLAKPNYEACLNRNSLALQTQSGQNCAYWDYQISVAKNNMEAAQRVRNQNLYNSNLSAFYSYVQQKNLCEQAIANAKAQLLAIQQMQAQLTTMQQQLAQQQAAQQQAAQQQAAQQQAAQQQAAQQQAAKDKIDNANKLIDAANAATDAANAATDAANAATDAALAAADAADAATAAAQAASDKAAADKVSMNPAPKEITIICLKGKSSLKLIGKNPKCPAGYKKK